jgi:hypothetical protein
MKGENLKTMEYHNSEEGLLRLPLSWFKKKHTFPFMEIFKMLQEHNTRQVYSK